MEEWECPICGHINWVDENDNFICVNCLYELNNNILTS